MPIYEYKCDRCDKTFECLVFSGEEDDVACPDCGERDVRRQMSSPSIFSSKGIGSCAAPASGGFS